MPILVGLTNKQSADWTDPMVGGLVVIGVLIGLAFLVVESRATEPIVPLSLFRIRSFTISVFSVFLAAFGFFATVEGLGGDGLVPAGGLGDEYFRFDEAAQRLVGDESGEEYALGRRLKLRLVEADPVSGALRFALPDAGADRPPPQRRDRRAPGRRGRPANIRHQGRRR